MGTVGPPHGLDHLAISLPITQPRRPEAGKLTVPSADRHAHPRRLPQPLDRYRSFNATAVTTVAD
jgi:hypothetical protein